MNHAKSHVFIIKTIPIYSLVLDIGEENYYASLDVLIEGDEKNIILDHPLCPSNSTFHIGKYKEKVDNSEIYGFLDYSYISFTKTLPDYTSNVIEKVMTNEDIVEIFKKFSIDVGKTKKENEKIFLDKIKSIYKRSGKINKDLYSGIRSIENKGTTDAIIKKRKRVKKGLKLVLVEEKTNFEKNESIFDLPENFVLLNKEEILKLNEKNQIAFPSVKNKFFSMNEYEIFMELGGNFMIEKIFDIMKEKQNARILELKKKNSKNKNFNPLSNEILNITKEDICIYFAISSLFALSKNMSVLDLFDEEKSIPVEKIIKVMNPHRFTFIHQHVGVFEKEEQFAGLMKIWKGSIEVPEKPDERMVLSIDESIYESFLHDGIWILKLIKGKPHPRGLESITLCTQLNLSGCVFLLDFIPFIKNPEVLPETAVLRLIQGYPKSVCAMDSRFLIKSLPDQLIQLDVQFVASTKQDKFPVFEKLKINLDNGNHRIALDTSTNYIYTCARQDNNLHFNICNASSTVHQISKNSTDEIAYEKRLKYALDYYQNKQDIQALKILVMQFVKDLKDVNNLSLLKCLELLWNVSSIDIIAKKHNSTVKELYDNLDKYSLNNDELAEIQDESLLKRKTKLRKKERSDDVQEDLNNLKPLLTISKDAKREMTSKVNNVTFENTHEGKSPFSILYKSLNDFADIQNKMAESLGRAYKRANSNSHHGSFFLWQRVNTNSYAVFAEVSKKKHKTEKELHQNLFFYVKKVMLTMLEKNGVKITSIYDTPEFDIVAFLKSNSLDHLKNVLQEHKITSKEMLMNLEPEELKELAPVLGDRVSLRSAISKLNK
jgi:hypothetical protein